MSANKIALISASSVPETWHQRLTMNNTQPFDDIQATVLIADDTLLNRELASDLLSSYGYKVLESPNGYEALEKLKEQAVDVILMDVMMPGMDGYETCRRIKEHPQWRLIPIVMLTSLSDVNSRVAALEAGADDFISKPFNEEELLARVKTSACNKQLSDHLEDTEQVLFALANVVEVKDEYTDQHLKRMAQFSERLARFAGLSAADQRSLRYGGILHDIGKVGISDMILQKPGKLTLEEYESVKRHTILGERIVQPLRFGRQIGPMVRGHHERWDGEGYPDGLSGESIPIGGRIIAICDTYDAMTSDRPYRKALTDEAAIAELQKMAGSQFDPRLVDFFILHLSEIKTE